MTGASFGGLTVWEYVRQFGGFDGYILKQPGLKASKLAQHLQAKPSTINAPVLIVQNANDNRVSANSVMSFLGELTPEQRKNITIYMPKVGNLSVETPGDYFEENIYVGHWYARGAEGQREEEEMMHFIDHLKDLMR